MREAVSHGRPAFLPMALSRPAIILLLAMLAACDQQEASAPPQPPPSVTVTPVARRAIVESVEFVGRVEAVDSVDLRARVQGFLTERQFREGEDVEVDELLFVIDPAPFQAQVDLAAANLAAAQAAVPETRRALERSEQLFSRGNVSEATLDQARAAAQQAEAAVAARQAELQQARINLSYTRISSPIAGRIGRAAFSVGNLIGPDSGVLANVTSVDPIYVSFPISERLLVARRQESIESGQPIDLSEVVLRLRLSNNSPYAQEGRIDFVGTAVDLRTGTVPVRGQFPNPNRLLQPGQFVTVVVSGRDPVSALVVPQAAIQEDQTGRYVLAVDQDNQVQVRRVTTGEQQGTDWVIQSGLQEGETVIVQGVQRVRPGAAVNPVMASAAVSPTGG